MKELDKLKKANILTYFNRMLELSRSGKEFPVNLEKVWPLAYERKDHAVRDLKEIFVQSIDYQVFPKKAENPKGGRPAMEYWITTSCMEFLIARKHTEVFEVYRQVFHKAVQQAQLSYPDALRQLAENIEQKQKLALENAELKPKADYHDKVLTSSSSYSITHIAKELGMTAISLNKLLHQLKVQFKVGGKGKWVLYAQHQAKGYTDTRTTTFEHKDGSIGTSRDMLWTEEGRKFIHSLVEEYEQRPSLNYSFEPDCSK